MGPLSLRDRRSHSAVGMDAFASSSENCQMLWAFSALTWMGARIASPARSTFNPHSVLTEPGGSALLGDRLPGGLDPAQVEILAGPGGPALLWAGTADCRCAGG